MPITATTGGASWRSPRTRLRIRPCRVSVNRTRYSSGSAGGMLVVWFMGSPHEGAAEEVGSAGAAEGDGPGDRAERGAAEELADAGGLDHRGQQRGRAEAGHEHGPVAA